VAPNILIFLRNFTALAQEVAGRRPALKISAFKHWLQDIASIICMLLKQTCRHHAAKTSRAPLPITHC